VDPTVGSDNEADSYSSAFRGKERVRGGKSFGRSDILASGLRADVRHIAELRIAVRRFRHLAFPPL
jgi:hypothetical protein